MLSAQELKELELKANDVRIDIIKMLEEAGSGHSAGPLGLADIFTSLYFHILNIDPKNPDLPERDRLVLSCGHCCPVLYAAMAEKGFFPKEELMTLRKLGSRLQGHPHRETLPGLETTSGPLGSGLSQACGMALAARLDNLPIRIYCVMSDGEQQEGNTWEAVMLAAKYKLNNLTAIIDRNNIQIDGRTEDVMPLESLKDKYEAFGWFVIEINGNNIEEFIDAVEKAKANSAKPTLILAYTIPGKGVSFMENDYKWHGAAPGAGDISGEPSKEEQVKIALKQLRTMGGKIRSEHE